LGLSQPFTEDLQKTLESRHKEIENRLRDLIGKPFYSDIGFILYCGDCCELMEHLQTSDFRTNLTITSPPYNIGKEYEQPTSLDAYLDWCTKWMTQLYYLTSKSGTLRQNLGYNEVPKKGLCLTIP
jgi:adenine-specific DNA-methyltransferase